MKVTVRCFASVRELFGCEVLELEVPPGTTVERLKSILADEHPEFARLPVALAVNRDYAGPERELADGDEVAFIPPISGGDAGGAGPGGAHAGGAGPGGADAGDPGRGDPARRPCRVLFVRGPLDPRALEREARTDRDGAVVTFAGVTRDHNEGAAVRGLGYEAYEEMARAVLLRILEDARARYEVGRVRVAHRLGEVPIGEASIVVVVAAAHRGPAFEACRAVMDRVKREVPIFKKEHLVGADGRSRWVGSLPQPRIGGERGGGGERGERGERGSGSKRS